MSTNAAAVRGSASGGTIIGTSPAPSIDRT